MGDQAQLLNNEVYAQSYPDPPPPYSPTQVLPNAPPHPEDPVPGQTQKFGVMPSGSPSHLPVVVPPAPPTVVQIQIPPPRSIILGSTSVRLICPHCQADVSTRVDKDPTLAAYVSCVMLILFGCVFGCCLIPLCMDSCRTCKHYCPNCKRFIGGYS